MKIPLADLHAQYVSIKSEIDSAIQKVVDSSQFILGDAVEAFEMEFARAHGAKHCIAVGSGTDALHASLWALGIGPGDAVITVPYTFIATVEAISLVGATPILVDIDPETYAMDPAKLQQALESRKASKKTQPIVKTIIPVHLYGQPAAMDRIGDIARNFGLSIVEDAAQAHLAQYDGSYVGNFGIAAAFSFYPGKNLGAFGEAGAIVTNDDRLALKLRQLRDHGQVEKYKHEFEGHNYRMDGIQGAVLGVKLKHLTRWTDRRRSIADLYKKLLRGVGDLAIPFESTRARHVYHLFVVRTKKRSELRAFLSERGVASALHYPIPLHMQPAYLHLGYKVGDFPVSEQAANECLSLPIYAEMTDEQVHYVADQVRAFFRD